jgi:hypothetical protein
MNLNELVKMRGFEVTRKIKLVRHQDPLYDLNLLYKSGMIEFYQSIQSKDVFGNCDYILSFLGEEGTKALFIGAYEITNCSRFNKEVNKMPENYPYMESLERPLFHYQLNKIPLLDDLVARLVIDWGKSTRSWFQWLNEDKPKQIIEVLPQGHVKEFPGFDELILTYHELKTIINNPDANRVWHTLLSSVAGIYLIVDMTDGSQYVGSAYGEHGLLGRWKTYVSKQDGGNTRLIALLQEEPDRYKRFQFSVLRTLPKSLTMPQVISYENIYKQKLGSRSYGLNGN